MTAVVTVCGDSGSVASTPVPGTVTAVDVSGGSTGLTFTGGPVTGSGTITVSGTLVPANGGTGVTTPYTYDVRRYGAVMDGVTNDSAALQAAIDAASAAGPSNATVVIPPGYMRLSTPIDLSDKGGTVNGNRPLRIRGSGAGIYGLGGSTTLILDTAATSPVAFCILGRSYITFEDMYVAATWDDGSTGTFPLNPIPNRSTVAFMLGRSTTSHYAQFVRFKNVTVYMHDEAVGVNSGRGAIAIYNMGAEHGAYDGCYFVGNTGTLIAKGDVLSVGSPYGSVYTGTTSFVKFTDCVFQSQTLTTAPVNIWYETSDLDFDHCIWTGPAGIATTMFAITSAAGKGACQNITFKEFHSEAPNQIGTIAGQVDRLTINGGIGNNSAATYLALNANVGTVALVNGLDFDVVQLNGSGQNLFTAGATGPVIQGFRAKLYNGQTINTPNLSIVGGRVTNCGGGAFAVTALLAGSSVAVDN